MPELRSLMLDRRRPGSVAQSLQALTTNAQGVRDQLSEDVWMVLADVERALQTLGRQPQDQGLHLTEAGERVLSGLLALSGIAGREHGPRPRLAAARRRPRPGACPAGAEPAARDARRVVRSRRRPRGARGGADRRASRSSRSGGATAGVPGCRPCSSCWSSTRPTRARWPTSCSACSPTSRAIPNTSPTARPLRLLDRLVEKVRLADPVALGTVLPARPPTRRRAPRPVATRWRRSAPSCTARCASSRRPSATTTTSRRPRSSRCCGSRRSPPGPGEAP